MKFKLAVLFLCFGLAVPANLFAQQADMQTMKEEFRKMDTDKSGFLTSEEMQAYEGRKFSELDKNNNGILEANELKADKAGMFIRADADKSGKVTRQRASFTFKEYFKFMDKNKDNKVSQGEYMDYWKEMLPY